MEFNGQGKGIRLASKLNLQPVQQLPQPFEYKSKI